VPFTSFEIETYGLPREETLSSCVKRFARMLEGLAAIHPAFRQWKKQGHTRAEANRTFCKMPPQPDELARVLADESRTDTTGAAGTTCFELWTGVWNGLERPYSVALHVHAGDQYEFINFPNHVTMHLPRPEQGNADLMNAECCKAAMRVLVEAWRPAWATLNDGVYGRSLLELVHMPPFRSGWMTYLSAPYAATIAPPSSAIVERMVDGGITMLATTDRFSADDPSHIAAADAIQASMQPLQRNPLLLRELGDGLYAQFPIRVAYYQNGRWATYKRAVFAEVFAEATIEPRGARQRLQFRDGSGADIAFGTPIGYDDDVFAVTFERFSGRSIMDAMFELARRTRSIISWPSDQSYAAVTDLDILDHLPRSNALRPWQTKLISHSDELEAYVFDLDARHRPPETLTLK
jgi:hypothetical protein